jgi:hypothetical protein
MMLEIEDKKRSVALSEERLASSEVNDLSSQPSACEKGRDVKSLRA